MYELIKVETENRIATLTINRPEFSNAISKDCVAEITDAMYALDQDETVGAVVITGAGKHFSAGGDVRRFKLLIESGEYLQAESMANTDKMCSAIRNCSKPVIAMVNGVATGAGIAVAAACDFRIVEPKSKLCMGFVNMGLPGDTGSIYLLMRLLGPDKAMRMMMTGEMVPGAEACEMGLATILAEDGKLAETTYAFAAKLAGKSAAAIEAQKRLVNKYFYGEDMEQFYLDEQKEMCAASRKPDFREATYAFLEKRTPVFNQK